jgi:3-oxoacyl-[acyl-carrier-protein] synthase-3
MGAVITADRRTGGGHSRILGTGSFRPARVVGNDEVAGPIDSSDEWIVSRSGIRTRRFADETEPVVDMAAAAGARALEDAGVDPRQIDTVLVASMSSQLAAPTLAARVAHRLGAGTPAALDLNAACSGFCYGTELASSLVRCGSARYVLLVGAERMSDLVDPADRATAFLFGDGAGAAVIGPSDTPGIGPVAWGSDGSRADVIAMTAPFGTVRRPQPPGALRMAGPAVFRWAISEMGDVAQLAVKNAGLATGDIDVFVPHQANLRIVEQLAGSLALRADAVVARDVVDAGNTSAASVPLALDRLRAEGTAHPGDLALLMGFGAGLAYAAQVVRLP